MLLDQPQHGVSGTATMWGQQFKTMTPGEKSTSRYGGFNGYNNNSSFQSYNNSYQSFNNRYQSRYSGGHQSYQSLLMKTLHPTYLHPSQLQQPKQPPFFAMGNRYFPKAPPPLLPTIPIIPTIPTKQTLPPPPPLSTTTTTTTTTTTIKTPSKLEEIQTKFGKESEKSKLFKESFGPNMDYIYQSNYEMKEKHNGSTFHDLQLKEKLNRMETVKNENWRFHSYFRSVCEKLREFTPFFRKFIPYNRHDHLVSEEAHVEFPKKDLLPVWTQEMEMEINNILNSPNNTHLVTAFSINIQVRDIRTLHGNSWLNDSVMEFYFNLITERSSKNPKYPSVYTFGTFFYTRLEKGQALGRWARKMDFFSYDILLMPINYTSHWRLVVVNNKEKKIEYYDSLGRQFPTCVNTIVKFLQAESREKQKVELNMSEWQICHLVPGIPMQDNSYDCGVFACKYAEYISRGAPISFSQNDIPFFRRCMMYEIVHKELLVH